MGGILTNDPLMLLQQCTCFCQPNPRHFENAVGWNPSSGTYDLLRCHLLTLSEYF